MRIAWFSPMPPLASGIGEYSVQLLPFVREESEVTVVSPAPGRFRKIHTPPGIDWETPKKWMSKPHGDQVPIYHLGNNAFHRYCYDAAMERPGVSVFHDIVMHHMLADVLVENGPHKDWEGYERVLREEHGETGTRLAALRRRHIATDFEKFLFPLFAHVARRSRSVVVHSEEMAERIAADVPDVPIHVIPHFAPPRPDELITMTRESARRELKLPQDAPIVGFLGYVTLPKQPEAVIEGFATLVRERPDAQLMLVGKDHTGGRLARWTTERPELKGKIRLTGFVDLIEFYKYLLAVDVVVNLRYPTVVESSGTNARALAEGRALVVSNVGAFAELPDDACCKVEIDEDQGAAVGRHLVRLFSDDAFRESIVGKGLEYAEANLDSRTIGHAFVDAARQAAALSVPSKTA